MNDCPETKERLRKKKMKIIFKFTYCNENVIKNIVNSINIEDKRA